MKIADLGKISAPRQMARALDTEYLIDELKARGYIVPRKDHVRTCNVLDTYDPFTFERMQATEAWMDSVKYQLASRLGRCMQAANALEWTEAPEKAGLVGLAARAYVVVPDPNLTTLEATRVITNLPPVVC